MVFEESPFNVLETSFRLLCEGPEPLAIDGREIGPPVPRCLIPLTELRGVLAHPATPFEARNRAIGLLARRARVEGDAWVVGLAGVLLPRLRAALSDLVQIYPGAAADLEADTLAELVEVVAGFEDGERVSSRLVWQVVGRARRRLLHDQAASAGGVGVCLRADSVPHRPWGHPDFVLAEAVRLGIVTEADAELVGETRLGGISVAEVAARDGRRVSTVRKQRARAEDRLATWLGARWGG